MAQARPLFAVLLGAAFQRLPAPIRRVHDGTGGEWHGMAAVQRGRSWLARCACSLGGLPADSAEQPLRVRIVSGDQEVWTRWFGGSRPMRSRFTARGGWLLERLGPVSAAVTLTVDGDSLCWTGQRLWILGVPLPRRISRIDARVSAQQARYHFEVAVGLAGIGDLIRYRGFLDVSGG